MEMLHKSPVVIGKPGRTAMANIPAKPKNYIIIYVEIYIEITEISAEIMMQSIALALVFSYSTV